jgi:hypothetical protein
LLNSVKVILITFALYFTRLLPGPVTSLNQ